MRKNLVILAAALAAAAALTACGGQAEETTAAETAAETTAEESAEAEETSAEEETEAAKADGELETVTVGASPAPHAEILEAAKEAMAEKGYDLEIVEYVDYVQPNLALDSGDLTANYFQHITYLEDFNAERGTHLASAGSIHYEPFGIYAGKTASLEELADGAQIAVPNDATNEARALLLLEAQGLITLRRTPVWRPPRTTSWTIRRTWTSWRLRPLRFPDPWAAWTWRLSTETTPSTPAWMWRTPWRWRPPTLRPL